MQVQEMNEVLQRLEDNKFIPDMQKEVLKDLLQGEEAEHFAEIINKLDEVIKKAPSMYETDGQKEKKAILHYFFGNYDSYAYELDKETGEMFGNVSLGYGFELGYFSIDEINTVPRIELDLYFDGKERN